MFDDLLGEEKKEADSVYDVWRNIWGTYPHLEYKDKDKDETE